ncbi:MAG: DUF2202 domain-containing protein [Promethearchaeota archaeon]
MTQQHSSKLYAIVFSLIIVGGVTGIILAFSNNTDPFIQNDPLSATEADDLLFIYEEEKLARDVYLFLYDEWGIAIFNGIAQSEQGHVDSVGTLLVRYSLTGSFMELERGVYQNPILQELYDDLTTWGLQSSADALRVGGSIEEIDILDLQEFISNTTHADIALTYERLMMGSYNHLRSFVSTMVEYGFDYEPLYLDQASYDTIIG